MTSAIFQLTSLIYLTSFLAISVAQDYNYQDPPEACKPAPKRGRGGPRVDFWYFDVETASCRWMASRSVYGNSNRFVTRAACMAYCRFQKTDPCETITCNERSICRAVRRTKCEYTGNGNGNGNGNGDGNGNGNGNGYGDNNGYNSNSWGEGCPPDYAVCEIPNGNITYRVPPVPLAELYDWTRPKRCNLELKSNLRPNEKTDSIPRMLVRYHAIDRKCKAFYVYPPAISTLLGENVNSAIDKMIKDKNAFLSLEDCMSNCAE